MARFSFQNKSAETIPPFAVMQLSAIAVIDEKLYYQMIQPTTDFQRVYYVNGPVQVPVDSFGQCSDAINDPVFALYQAASENAYDLPVMFQGWGTQANSWYLSRGGYGFTVVGTYDSEGTITMQTLAVDATPKATFTTVFTEAAQTEEDEDTGDDEDETDDSGDKSGEDDTPDEEGGDEAAEEDEADHTMDHVLVKQEPVNVVYGQLLTPLAYIGAAGNDGSGGSAWTWSYGVADVHLVAIKPNYSKDPVEMLSVSLSTYLRNALPACVTDTAKEYQVGYVVCAWIAGFWMVFQSELCPTALPANS